MKTIFCRRRFFPSCLLAVLVFLTVFSSACAEKPLIGDEDYNAPVIAIRYETIDDSFDGVVYRQIPDFTRLMAKSELPLLVVFYELMGDINIQIMPVLEELAIVYHDRLQIVWIDIYRSERLGQQFSVDRVPMFSMVERSVLKRSLTGFSETGRADLIELIEPYVKQVQPSA